MLFSIVTITRNNRAGLKRTAQSVKDQTCRNFEWLIIDGASTDGTKDDFAIYDAIVVSEPDAGIYDAMNKGLSKAQGDYLLFLNAGDSLVAPNTLENMTAAIKKPADFLYGDSLEADLNGIIKTKKAKPPKSIAKGMFTHHQAMLYNRNSLGHMRYDPSYKIAGDYDLTLRFLGQKNIQSVYLSFPICIFEGGGVSQRQTNLGLTEQYRARKAGGIPLRQNIATTMRQKAANMLRRFSPNLYWTLKGF
jgi:putative colanic acid biosynthesis glycosyltransferase